ncbi:MAG: cardiolipin synthase [Puniceicoccaceae bacterium]
MDLSIWQGIWEYGVATLLLLFQIAGFFLAGRVLLSNRSTQGTIAWALSLIMLPLAAVPIYLMFGRNRLHSYIEARRRVDREFARTHPLEKEHGSISDFANPAGSSFDWHVLKDLAKAPLSEGNEVDFHFTGRDTFDSMIKGIEKAKHYVLFQFFIFRNDDEGRLFTEALKKKAASGVQVFFLVDGLGSGSLNRSFFKDLRQAGIKTGLFIPGRTIRGRLRLNFRNHRKVIIVDGKEAWIGGHNIGVEYVGDKPEVGPWRDTHVHIRGPVLNAIQLAFLEDWFWVTREMPELNWDASTTESGKVRALCLATGPADTEDTCTLAYVHMINRAKKRIWIHSPYFVPADEVIVALQLAAMRGVDVRILMPSQRDHLLVWLSSFYFSALPELNKVRFFRYSPGFFHSKMMLVDDDLLSVGTVNFDNRSFRINFEITLLLEDPDTIRQCHEQMERDFLNATEDPVDPLAKRNIFFKLAARGSRLLSPLL